MEDNVKKARLEFMSWFENNVCAACEYDDNIVSSRTIDLITTKQKELCIEYNISESEFEGILYRFSE